MYVYAVLLLYYEYVRYVSEAWYSHKLFIYLNLTFHTIHMIIFGGMHSEVFLILAIARCIILSLILVTQCMTIKRSASNRIVSSDNFEMTTIERSKSFFDYNEVRRDP